MKRCNGPCNLEKDENEFGIDRKKIDGLRTICKSCHNIRNAQYYDKNKESICIDRKDNYHNGGGKIKKQNSYESNKEQHSIMAAEYYQENREQLLEKSNNYYEEHKEERAEYYQGNKQRINKRVAQYIKERKQKDINFKLACSLRDRIHDAILRHSKTGSAVKDLGCSIKEFKKYIEALFQADMTWENYGLYGWHLDHIIPLASFNLSDREQFLKACHYTNYQPLWAKDNLSKGSKIL